MAEILVNPKFKARWFNPEYESGIKTMPLRACLNRDNSNSRYLRISARERSAVSVNYNELRKIINRQDRIKKNEVALQKLCESISILECRIETTKFASTKARFLITLENKRQRLQKLERLIKKRQTKDIIKRYEFDKRNIKIAVLRARKIYYDVRVDREILFKVTQPKMVIQTLPKWLTAFSCDKLENDTGEILESDVPLYSDTFKANNHKKIKNLDKWANFYQPLYEKKKVSLMMLTLTDAVNSNFNICRMVEQIKYNFKKYIGEEVKSYLWTLEIKPNIKMGGFNVHYHMGIATDRLDFDGGKIPDKMKFDNVWGRMCRIGFVESNVKHYLAKYFAKNNSRAEGWRSYGKSLKFK